MINESNFQKVPPLSIRDLSTGDRNMICWLWSSFILILLPRFLRPGCLRLGFWCLVGIMLFAVAPPVYAQITNADVDDYFEFLARANDYSPLEHGGSHGTLGFGVGLGMAGYEAPTNADLMRDHWRGANQPVDSKQEASGRVLIPRVQMFKGLPGSTDVGLGIGRDPLSRATLVSGYSQWTVYEAFAMPALAIRGGFNRLLGLAATDASSLTLEGVASYGFLRFFTIYAGIGVGRHQIEVRSGNGFGTVMTLDGDTETTINRVLIRRSRSVGLKVQLIPAFADIGLEAKRTGDGPATYLAKISFGM
jgi:opacity protein-like surface antigen